MSRLLVIPAAGLGSRLGASVPKVLVRVAGETMLDRLLALYRGFVDRVVEAARPALAAVWERFAPHVHGAYANFLSSATDDEVVFVVTDDGPGVPPEIADYMFEPFASNTSEGTGLGLAIAAYVMQMLGGKISYRKDATRGACFSATLPRRAPEPPPSDD